MTNTFKRVLLSTAALLILGSTSSFANTVLKVGATTTSTGATQLSGTDGIECNKDNRGKMNFKTHDNGSDVFGICMRNKDGNYYWAYMVGGNNPTNGTGTFGSGL